MSNLECETWPALGSASPETAAGWARTLTATSGAGIHGDLFRSGSPGADSMKPIMQTPKRSLFKFGKKAVWIKALGLMDVVLVFVYCHLIFIYSSFILFYV